LFVKGKLLNFAAVRTISATTEETGGDWSTNFWAGRPTMYWSS